MYHSDDGLVNFHCTNCGCDRKLRVREVSLAGGSRGSSYMESQSPVVIAVGECSTCGEPQGTLVGASRKGEVVRLLSNYPVSNMYDIPFKGR